MTFPDGSGDCGVVVMDRVSIPAKALCVLSDSHDASWCDEDETEEMSKECLGTRPRRDGMLGEWRLVSGCTPPAGRPEG